MKEMQDWKNLATLDKIEHKNWIARCEGYEEAINDMQKNLLFDPYIKLTKYMILDSNVVAQEKALEVILYIVHKAHITNNIAIEICNCVINKCLSSTRKTSRELGIEILKTIIYIEKYDIVFEELRKFIGSTNPKLVVCILSVMRSSLHEFGFEIFPLNDVLRIIPKLLEDRDKNIREAGKDLIVEMYRWFPQSTLKSLLTQLKPLQVTELTAKFEKLPSEKPTPTRYLKSQKPKEGAVLKPTGGGDNVSQNSVVKATNIDIDPYDLVDPVEVISAIPSKFYESIEEKKWTDRKEALEIIDKLTNHEKLMPGEYGELMKALLKVMSKDSNIVLVALAGKIVYQIAKGLRKKFFPYALSTIQICFDKFKEKKANVVKVLRDCIDFAFKATTFDACVEEIVNALDHKTPSVRSETALFLNRVFEKSTPESLTGKILKQLMPNLTKLCLDSTPEVRDAAFQSLGTAMKVVSEKKLKPFLDKMDNVKMARINEFYEKAKMEIQVPIGLVAPVATHATAAWKPDQRHIKEKKIKIVANDVDLESDLRNISIRKRSNSSSDNYEELNVSNMKSPRIQIVTDMPDYDDDDNTSCETDKFTIIESIPESCKSKLVEHKPNDYPNCETHFSEYLKKPVQISYDRKCSKFYQSIQSSKIAEKELWNSYLWLKEFDRNFKQQNKYRIHLMKDQIKRTINNIHGEHLLSSCYASNCFNEMVAERPAIVSEYGSFLLVVICQQMQFVISRLSNGNFNSQNIDAVLRNLFVHFKQIVNADNLIDSFDDELILIAMFVLLNVSRCQPLSLVPSSSIIIQSIETIAVMIYRKTLCRELTDIVKILSIQIKEPSLIKENLLSYVNLSEKIEDLYEKYIQIPNSLSEKVDLGYSVPLSD